MKILCLLNPVSGKVAPCLETLKKRIHRIATQRGWQLTLVQTEYPGHATEIANAEKNADWDRIAFCGGDGILNEVARALVHSPGVLGVLPFGSGNGLARHLGIPLRLEAACEVLDSGRTDTIDTGTADGHPFFNVAGVGFDAEIGRQFNALTKRGPIPYFKASLATLRKYQQVHYKIVNGTHQTEGKALLVSVANSCQFGNNARIAPLASVQDGQLDLIHLPINGPFSAMTSIIRLFLGTLHRSSRVTYWQGETFSVTLPPHSILHTDGEIHSCGGEIKFQIHPRSLHVCLPPGGSRKKL